MGQKLYFLLSAVRADFICVDGPKNSGAWEKWRIPPHFRGERLKSTAPVIYSSFTFYHKNFVPLTNTEVLSAGAAAECGASRDKIIQSPPHQHLMMANILYTDWLHMCASWRRIERRIYLYTKKVNRLQLYYCRIEFYCPVDPCRWVQCEPSIEAQPEVRHSRANTNTQYLSHAAHLGATIHN